MTVKFEDHWAQVLAAVFLIIGIIISATNPYFLSIILFISGMLASLAIRTRKKNQPMLPFLLIIVGFSFGILLGSLRSSPLLAILSFLLGFTLYWYLDKKEFFKRFKSGEILR